ncbi:HAMP domain-containing sensor histidine kinase [Brevundimonas sp.]|uniref:sensor histidine kinase n=1 Tax=Brevundimonas sp. TaxID=1871086 RepID=UPI001DA3404A|nr:HAMP domain-containing sensor histidine kinase [Brevundimonas sp.]MBA4001275.1 hypothetical protein [Brevundimonas sp.]
MHLILETPLAGAQRLAMPTALLEHAEAGPLIVRVSSRPDGETTIDEGWGNLSSLRGSPLRTLTGADLAAAIGRWADGPVRAHQVSGRAFSAPDGVVTYGVRIGLARGLDAPSPWFILIEAQPFVDGGAAEVARLMAALESAEARLRTLEASRAVAGRFSAQIADLSHELRTPLNGVLAIADVLAARPLPDHDLELAKLIRDSGAAMLALLNRTLRDAREIGETPAGEAPAAAADITSEAFALEPLLDALSGIWSVAARRKGLAFHVSAPDLAGVVVKGDPVRLNQVLTNLLSNAVKFTTEGQVAFRVERTPTPAAPIYRFVVEDTGPGFSPEIRARLFSRGATQANDIDQGAGLGLSLVRRFAEGMGGVVQAQDIATGGARVIVELPMPEIEPPSAATRPQAAGRWSRFLDRRR